MPKTTQSITGSSSVSGQTTDEKLDKVIFYLQRMDRRDKWRTVGGFCRTLISFIPLFLLLWSAWYIVGHGNELMQTIIKQTASATAEASQNAGQGMVDKFMKQYGTK